MHFALQELQDAVGTTVGAGVNLTGQLTRAAVPVAQGIVGAVRGIAKKQSSCFSDLLLDLLVSFACFMIANVACTQLIFWSLKGINS